MNNEQKAQSLPSASLVQNGLLSAALSVEDASILIGEFMGKFDFERAYCRSHGLPEYNPHEDLVEVKEFKYNSSFDWLMPVVKKIQQLKIEEFSKKKPVMSALMDVDIEILWTAVVAFLKWYSVSVGSR